MFFSPLRLIYPPFQQVGLAKPLFPPSVFFLFFLAAVFFSPKYERVTPPCRFCSFGCFSASGVWRGHDTVSVPKAEGANLTHPSPSFLFLLASSVFCVFNPPIFVSGLSAFLVPGSSSRSSRSSVALHLPRRAKVVWLSTCTCHGWHNIPTLSVFTNCTPVIELDELN